MTTRDSCSILVLLVQDLAFCKGSPLFRSLQVFIHTTIPAASASETYGVAALETPSSTPSLSQLHLSWSPRRPQPILSALLVQGPYMPYNR
jgi:hypothetical protein